MTCGSAPVLRGEDSGPIRFLTQPPPRIQTNPSLLFIRLNSAIHVYPLIGPHASAHSDQLLQHLIIPHLVSPPTFVPSWELAMPPSGPTFPVPSGKTAQVRIIDSTARLGKIPVSYLMQPPMQNLSHMPTLPSWSFLVESSSGKKALFDLGVPQDVMSMAPVVADSLRQHGWEIDVAEEVIDILRRQGISAEEIDSIVWR